MKAIRVHEFGDAEQLKYEDAPMPAPGSKEVRVQVKAAGVNFIDIYHRTGKYPNDLPITPGLEAAGVVDAVGEDVAGVVPGDRVAYALGMGSYAEYTTVPAWQVVPVPDGVDFEHAAAVMLQGMTAHYLTHSTYPLREGDTALVLAAAGGVGHLLVQIAKMHGARVIATCSTEEKAELARSHGADDVIRYTEVDMAEAVDELTDGAGVDVVYDSVGKDTFYTSLDCLKKRGYMVLYGQSSGVVEPVDPQIFNRKGSLFFTRPSLFHYAGTREETLERAGDLFRWMAAGELDVRIDRAFPLEEAGDAHRYMEGRKTKGKLLLIP